MRADHRSLKLLSTRLHQQSNATSVPKTLPLNRLPILLNRLPIPLNRQLVVMVSARRLPLLLILLNPPLSAMANARRPLLLILLNQRLVVMATVRRPLLLLILLNRPSSVMVSASTLQLERNHLQVLLLDLIMNPELSQVLVPSLEPQKTFHHQSVPRTVL